MFGSLAPSLWLVSRFQSLLGAWEPTMFMESWHWKPLNESYPCGFSSDAHPQAATKWLPVHLNNHPTGVRSEAPEGNDGRRCQPTTSQRNP